MMVMTLGSCLPYAGGCATRRTHIMGEYGTSKGGVGEPGEA